MSLLRLLLAATILAASLLAHAADPVMIGYRGDGTCVAKDAKPPTTWDEKTGKNILWRAPLPNWSHSCPIAVGKRVFTMSEPCWKADFPILSCFDADTGKLLWEKEVDHTPALGLPEEKRKAIVDAWHGCWTDLAKRYALIQPYRAAKDADAKKAAEDAITAAGYRYDARWGRLLPTDPKEYQAKMKLAATGGFTEETWWQSLGGGWHCIGHTFSTPVSDGTNVYVVTPWGGFAAYDMDGTQLWLKYYPGQKGEYCRNGRSPILYGNLLISDITAKVRAIDTKTGELKWSAPVDGETMETPAVITVDGKDILLCFNKKAFLLPDGKPLKVGGSSDFGATMLVKADERNVVFFTGGGEHGGWTNKGAFKAPKPADFATTPACVKFSLDGDTLTGKVLWDGINGEKTCAHAGLAYANGKLYHGMGIALDAATGKPVLGSLGGGRVKAQGTANTKEFLWIVGDYLYGLNAARGGRNAPADVQRTAACEIYTLDGKKVASNTLTSPAPDDAKRDQIIHQCGATGWAFSYSFAFTVSGNRLYVRSFDELICIGAKE